MTTSRTVRIELLKPHKHAGTKHAEGTTIPVPEHDAVWLENNGVGKTVKTVPTESSDVATSRPKR